MTMYDAHKKCIRNWCKKYPWRPFPHTIRESWQLIKDVLHYHNKIASSITITIDSVKIEIADGSTSYGAQRYATLEFYNSCLRCAMWTAIIELDRMFTEEYNKAVEEENKTKKGQ